MRIAGPDASELANTQRSTTMPMEQRILELAELDDGGSAGRVGETRALIEERVRQRDLSTSYALMA